MRPPSGRPNRRRTDMAAVSESIVREYFELHGFFVRQQRKYVAPTRKEDEEIDFFVLNPQPRAGDGPLPFVITMTGGRAVCTDRRRYT